jgi:small-conductance mechanosensitive channel
MARRSFNGRRVLILIHENPTEPNVERIILEAALEEPEGSNYQKPAVRFVEYGDNSINFVLLIWIDVRKTPRRRVRSAFYFSVFDKFKNACIEIPFPQRYLHIKSNVASDHGEETRPEERFKQGREIIDT